MPLRTACASSPTSSASHATLAGTPRARSRSPYVRSITSCSSASVTQISRSSTVRPMATARNGNCELYYETFGDSANPTLLLVNGLGSQSINFADGVDREVRRPRTARHPLRQPRRRQVDVVRRRAGSTTRAPTYRLADMAEDADRGARRGRRRASTRDGRLDGRDDRPAARDRSRGPPVVDDVGDVDAPARTATAGRARRRSRCSRRRRRPTGSRYVQSQHRRPEGVGEPGVRRRGAVARDGRGGVRPRRSTRRARAASSSAIGASGPRGDAAARRHRAVRS